MVCKKTVVLDDTKLRILRALVKYRSGGVDLEQLAARLGLCWRRMKKEMSALEAMATGKHVEFENEDHKVPFKASPAKVVEWWLENGGLDDAGTKLILGYCGKRPGSPSPQIKVGWND